MLNHDPLLSQKPFQVLGSYEPNFFLTKIKLKIPQSNQDDFLSKSLLYSSTHVHEQTHWNQFAGTTWGNWCMFIYFSRMNLFFDGVGGPIMSEMLKVIKDFSPTFNYTLDPNLTKKYPSSFCLFYQDWLAHTLTYNFFMEGDPKFEKVRGLSEYISTAMSYAYFSVNNYLSLGEKGLIKDYEELLNFKDLAFVKPFNENFLTVKHLLEGQARATEIIHTSSSLSIAFKDGNKLLNYSDTYWGAFNLYLKIHNLNYKDVVVNSYWLLLELTKFITLVDIALNPALPPFADKEILKTLNWSKIYPPYIFFKACIASRNIQIKINPFNEDDIVKYYYLICGKLEIDTPFDLARYFLESNKAKLNTLDKKWKKGDINNLEMFDYLHFVINKFCKIRLSNPIYIPNMGLASIGEHSTKNIDVLVDLDNKFNYISSSPLVIDLNRNEKLLYTPLTDNLGKKIFYWLTYNLFFNHIINNNFMFNKSISNNDFPFFIPDNLKDNIIKSSLENFDKNIEWN